MAQKQDTELRQRRPPKTDPTPEATEDGNEESESMAVLKGLVQCVLGIGGISLIMWLVFYLVMPPQGFSNISDQPCNRISSARELIIALKDVSDWKLLGENLGMNPGKLEIIDHEHEEMEHKKRAVLRAWFEGKEEAMACWEEVIRALQANEKDTKLAKELADKYQKN